MRKLELPSDKKFGVMFSIIFLLLGLYQQFYIYNSKFSWTFFGFAGAVLFIAFYRPQILHRPNLLWNQLGKVMGVFVSPIILGLMFYFIITPVAIFLKIIRRDRLSIKKSNPKSYWINRAHKPADLESFKNQY